MKTTTNKGETNMKTTIKLIGIITIVIMAFAIAGCKDDTTEQPSQQSRTLQGLVDKNGTPVNVTVNFTGLSTDTPSYIAPLTAVFESVMPNYVISGNLIINVIAGSSGFAKTASKTLSVGEAWISGKEENDIGVALMGSAIFNDWIA